jgi:hypothetical protein
MSENIKIKSVITCPICKFKKEEFMLPDFRQYFYVCEECKARLKPNNNDCCVFTSFGTTPCPAMQEGIKGGCNGSKKSNK